MILRIKNVLKEKGMSNKTFAERMGKYPQYTSAVINERSTVSLKMLKRMADVLGVPLKELFY